MLLLSGWFPDYVRRPGAPGDLPGRRGSAGPQGPHCHCARQRGWNAGPGRSGMPGLGVVVHHGRRSGRRYQTPVNVFTAGDGYVFALTYGPDTDWVKNVLAAGGCELRTRGQTIQLGSPRLFHDERRAGIRPVERQVLRILDVADFLSLRPVGPARTRLSAQPDRRLHRRRARRRLARSECGGDVSRPPAGLRRRQGRR